MRRIPALLLAAILVAAHAHALENFDFEQRYFMEPGLIAADHAIIIKDGEFHLFYTVGYQGEGWQYPGNMIDFGHATSSDLIHWEVHDRVLSIESPGWKERNLWAPFITPNWHGNEDGKLYFTGVNEAVAQRIGLATSEDLFNWEETASNPIYKPDTTWAYWQLDDWSNCRDPFVERRSRNEYFMITTTSTKPGYMGIPESRGAISLAYSTNGIDFTDDGAPLFINDSHRVLESPYMLERNDIWYLFFNEQGITGVQYMTSNDPYTGWNKANAQLFEYEGFAAEVFTRGGVWLLARVRDAMWEEQSILGIKIDDLTWAGDTPVIGPQNAMLDDWTVVSGNAFDLQPTFGDRPRDRTGVNSTMDGFFWINTAEQHAGPIAWGCPECPPEDGLTGILRSRTFELDADYVTLRVGGGDDPDSLYVALMDADTQTPIHLATGNDSDVMRLVIWETDDYTGTEVYLEIVDLQRDGPFGHISVDSIVETDEPPLTGVGDPDHQAAGGRARLRLAPVTPTRAPVRFLLDVRESGPVRLELHDATGRLVRGIDYGSLANGRHRLIWDGRLSDGGMAPRGIYFYRIDGVPGSAGKLVLAR